MKKMFLGLVAPFVLSAQANVSAQSVKPVVVVSLAGYDELMSDVDFLAPGYWHSAIECADGRNGPEAGHPRSRP